MSRRSAAAPKATTSKRDARNHRCIGRVPVKPAELPPEVWDSIRSAIEGSGFTVHDKVVLSADVELFVLNGRNELQRDMVYKDLMDTHHELAPLFSSLCDLAGYGSRRRFRMLTPENELSVLSHVVDAHLAERDEMFLLERLDDYIRAAGDSAAKKSQIEAIRKYKPQMAPIFEELCGRTFYTDERTF